MCVRKCYKSQKPNKVIPSKLTVSGSAAVGEAFDVRHEMLSKSKAK